MCRPRQCRRQSGGKTYTPEHYAITAAQTHDYQTFYLQESQARAELGYPPYVCLSVAGQRYTGGSGSRQLFIAVHCLQVRWSCLVLHPALWKVRSRFRWQLVVRGDSSALVGKAAATGTTLAASVDWCWTGAAKFIIIYIRRRERTMKMAIRQIRIRGSGTAQESAGSP